MSPKIYFISGASRGIGLALTEAILAHSQGSLIYAGVRNPSDKASKISQLIDRHPGVVIPVAYEAGDIEKSRQLSDIIREGHGLVDVVIACAAISECMKPASETPVSDFRAMLEVNTIGILVLFQALFPLLKASSEAKFIALSSGAASLTAYIQEDNGLTGYGASKVAMNYICRKIHYENSWITCFPLAPGVVDTDMLSTYISRDTIGDMRKHLNRIKKSPREAADRLLEIIVTSTRDACGGQFIDFDGSTLAW